MPKVVDQESILCTKFNRCSVCNITRVIYEIYKTIDRSSIVKRVLLIEYYPVCAFGEYVVVVFAISSQQEGNNNNKQNKIHIHVACPESRSSRRCIVS